MAKANGNFQPSLLRNGCLFVSKHFSSSMALRQVLIYSFSICVSHFKEARGREKAGETRDKWREEKEEEEGQCPFLS